MKNTLLIITSLAMLLLSQGILAQTPQMINYQAVVRDEAGEPMANQELEIEISILQGTIDGSPVVIEMHHTTSNELGLVNLHVGSILPLDEIDWGAGPYFLEVKVDGELLGASQLLSVPYALHAESSADAFSGDYDDLENAPDLSGVIAIEDPSEGDMLYYNADGWQKLPLGDEGQVLSIVEGEPAWTTIETDTEITDADGNVYGSVTIGSQQWLDRNLRTSSYNNGDPIPTGMDNDQWIDLTEGAVATYPHDMVEGIDSEEEMVDIYGRLYNWYAVDDDRGICPPGYRVPTDDDYDDLIFYLIGEGHDDSYGNVLKSCRQDGSPLGGDCDTDEHPYWFFNAAQYGTDDYGFGALPSGYRHGENGDFFVVTFGKYMWTADEDTDVDAIHRMMLFASGLVLPSEGITKNMGNSIRCIKE